MTESQGQLYLIRHGETAWSKTGQHTGRQDLPLTPAGEEQARAAGRALGGRPFPLVLVSPLLRARQTCDLSGYGGQAEVCGDLQEWHYGDYESLTAADIRAHIPDWNIWTHGVTNGESADDVAARADRVLARCRAVRGDVALFAHGHLLRILTTRWLGLAPRDARLFAFGTASLSILGHENGSPAIRLWNQPMR
ncbi:MAG: histidine phosphatase family protein [Bryobacterales bacterium]|nr:histidine phosphatase family protein [Bryobacterales bacterium]